MYIFKSNTTDGTDELLSKSSKGLVGLQKSAEGVLARIQAPVVPAQVAVLNEAIAPVGIVLGNMMDSVVLAGVVSSIGQPVPLEYMRDSANEKSAQADEVIAKNALSILANTPTNILPISSLSEAIVAQSAATQELNLTVPKITNLTQVIDLADTFLLSQGTPILIKDLSDDGLSITVIEGVKDNVQITDFVPAQSVSENFINTGLGKLTIITPATSVASLSLSGNVEFTATAMEVTSGITVSGESDASNVVLYITGGASKAKGGVDVINLGDGNNLVFDAGDGAILMNFGSGSNSVILTGIGVSGVVSFDEHNNALSDSVAISPNGFSSSENLASIPLVTITGLNVNSQSADTISFLGDFSNDLRWADGSAQNAQINSVQGDAANLAVWIGAAQNKAASAHSIAWFHFDGATYILEAPTGNSASHTFDTLVKLSGTITFTGVDGELSPGMLHLLG